MNTFYVPILKAKEGELSALNELSGNVAKKVFPLLEIVPDTRLLSINEKIKINDSITKLTKKSPHKFTYKDKKGTLHVKGRMTEKELAYLRDISKELNDEVYAAAVNQLYTRSNPTIQDYLKGVFTKMVAFKLTGRTLYIDFHHLEENKHRVNLLELILQEISMNNIKAILVFSVEELNKYSKTIIESGIKSLAIRINGNEIDSLKEIKAQLKTNLDIPINQVDLIIDHKSLQGGDNQLYVREYERITEKDVWGRLIFAGASFPVDLMGYPPYSEHDIPRIEWQQWKYLAEKHDNKNITYSDYTIRSSQLPLAKFGISPSANIRYTHDDIWFLVRGKSIKHDPKGNKQYYDISNTILVDAKYAGENHCEGDKLINMCANKKCGPGNQTTWITAGITHHITTVVEQLSSFLGTLK